MSVKSSSGLLLRPWRLLKGTCTRQAWPDVWVTVEGHVYKCQITHDKALGVVSETWTYQKPEDQMPDDENKGTGAGNKPEEEYTKPGEDKQPDQKKPGEGKPDEEPDDEEKGEPGEASSQRKIT